MCLCFISCNAIAISCDPGYYKSENECKKCYTKDFYSKYLGFVCPGIGEDILDSPAGTTEEGLLKCDDDTVVDEQQHICNRTKGQQITLKPGHYADGKEREASNIKFTATDVPVLDYSNEFAKVSDVNISQNKILALVHCEAGYVLGAGSTCLECSKFDQDTVNTAKEQGLYCPGGDFYPGTKLSDQLKSCGADGKPTDKFDGCNCNPGSVFVGFECVRCDSRPVWVNYAKENRVYCPGTNNIKLGTSLKEQVKPCPAGMWPTDDLTYCKCAYNLKEYKDREYKCIGSLSYTDMYYGPEGPSAPLDKQCWTKTTEEAYKKCMGFD